jgi:uncharacterized protein
MKVKAASPSWQIKLQKAKDILRSFGSVLVAFSGGTDSSLLLYLAREELGDRAVGLLASSPTYPQAEIAEAKKVAEEIGARCIEISSNELQIPDFVQNTPQRCYYCKAELLHLCREKARTLTLQWVIDGTNFDDRGDFRPGMKAARELGIRSPLLEAGLTKREIREASRSLGLSTWDKPSLACLASRFPYGTPITLEGLSLIEKAEEFMRRLGFRQVRVRYHGKIARVEVEPRDFKRLLGNETRRKVTQSLRQIGFTYVTLDLEGYRTGSMNETLDRKGKKSADSKK